MIKLLHSRFLGLLLIFLLATQSNYAQDVIHCWNFNNASNESTNRFPSPIEPNDNRTVGTGTITHNFSTDQTRSGAGSSLNACGTSAGRSLTFRGGVGLAQNGKQLSFNFSSEGYEDLIFSFWTRGTGSGFNDNLIEYSTDGNTFTSFPPVTPTNDPSANPYDPEDPGTIKTYDLSSISSIENQSGLIIRITFNGATNASGTNNLDNVKLEGTFINDTDSEVLAPAPASQIAAKDIVAADVTTPVSSEAVLNFDIQDVGTADGLPTEVNQMRFVPGGNNTANWSTTLQDVIIRGSGGVITGTSVITDTEVIFTPDAPVEIPNNDTSSFTAEIVLFDTGIVDLSVIEFQINGTDSGFTALPSGSFFSSPLTDGVITGNEITIDVVASDIAFIQQPTDTSLNLGMSPSVEIGFVDINGNLDTDFGNTTSVSLTSTGELVGEPLSSAAEAGIVTFSSLTHSSVDLNLNLNATSDPTSGSFTATSAPFNISDNDFDTEVVDPPTQIAPSTEVAATTTTLPVFSFDIEDKGSGDGLPTTVTQMRFVAGPNNTAVWTTTFSGVNVQDASLDNIPGTTVFNGNEIIFTPTTPIVIAEGPSENFTVEVTLDQSNIVDESVIQFQVDGIDSGFEAQLDGSLFSSSFTNVVGNNITLDVVATQIIFLQQPTDVEVNTFISPAVEVAYVDGQENIDTSITTDISLTSNGGVLESPLTPVSAVDGVATFPNIGYTAEELLVNLTAETTQPGIAPTQITSADFEVISAVIAIQDFDGTTPEWLYDTSVSTFDNGWDVSGFFGVINSVDASPLTSGSFVENIFGVNNLNSSETLDFVSVNVSGYTNVELSFDWEAIGNGSSTESISYEIFLDGAPQGLVNLYIGDGTTLSGSGAVSESIPPGTQEVSLVVTVEDDGLDSYIGLDNFKLTGDSNARDTDIIAADPQIEAGTIFADINDDLANAVDVFGFDIVDSGNFDALPTNVTRLRFVPGSGNTADWATVLQGISISDDNNTLDQAGQTVTITSDEILVDIDTDPDDVFTVGDGATKTYTLSLFLNTSGIIDQEVIQLAIADGKLDQLASSDGSIFSQDITAFEGNEFDIEVIGTQLEFLEQPTNTVLGVNMAPPVRVRNLDSNGNEDLDEVTVSITSTGTLTGDPVQRVISASNGYANFNTLQHTALGLGLTLTASSSGLTSVTSDAFDIIFDDDLLISEVVASSTPNERFVELFNMGVEDINFSTEIYYLHNATEDESIQLTGNLAAKSYYVISFDNSLSSDLTAPSVITGDGNDVYFLSSGNTELSLIDVHGVISESNNPSPSWDYTDGRFYRNIPTVRTSNQIYTASEWLPLAADVASNATPGIGDNDFIYNGDWTTSGLGDPEGGSFTGSNSDKSIFVESGTATLSIANTISDVVVRDGATLIIEDAITLNGDFANFTTSGSGKVTFRSTSTKTGTFGAFNSNNRRLVGTNYEIERYIPDSNRAFRYLSSPVNTSSDINPSVYPKPTIRDNWQEGQNRIAPGDENRQNSIDGFGTHITGSQTGQLGFDATETGFPSMFEWNAIGQSWDPIPDTNTKGFNAGEAYAILIRGDRSTTLESNTALGEPTTLRTTGRLVAGSQSEQNIGQNNGEFTLIGNPYQAKVDMSTVLARSQGVSSGFAYIYDPTLGTRGGYATVDLTDGSNTTTIPESSGANQFLEPNQAFFVETTDESVNNKFVFFEEVDKSIVTSNNTTFSVPEEQTDLAVSLFFDNINTKAVDGVKVKFRPGANNAKDTLDATKIWNYDESVAINRNPNYMSIETRGMPSEQDSIPLYFGFPTKLAYRWEINPKHFTSAEAYLYDKYLETAIELPSDQVTTYSFTLDNSIPESTATDRFVIRFDNVTLSGDDFEQEASFVVYPNPIKNNRFSIAQRAFEGSSIDLQVFDLQGRLVMNQNIDNAPTVEVNLKDTMSSGVYILKLSDGKASQSIKLIVE